jgi:CheY-like chemotaxis protein
MSNPGLVMVVEDDDEIRESLQLLLGDHGYTVLGARNGAEALEELKNGFRPALILLDLMMPVMNGWQLLDMMNGDDELARIPVAVVTAHPDRIAASSIGPRVLGKPIDTRQLLAVVRESVHGA